MRTIATRFAIAALFAAVAPGQSPADARAPRSAAYQGKAPDGGADAVRVLYATRDQTPQDLQETVNLIRTLADVQRMYPYATQRAIAVRGTPAQVALAEWLFGELDKPAGAQKTAACEFATPGGADAVRVLYFTHDETPEDLQRIVNLIRTEADIQRMFASTARRAVALRGTPDQAALAEWLFGELSKPAGSQANQAAAYSFPTPNGGSDAVRLLYLTRDETPQDVQEIVSAVRTTADIQRIFAYGARRAIAVRGSASQIALAEWLFGQLDAPSTGRASAQPAR